MGTIFIRVVALVTAALAPACGGDVQVDRNGVSSDAGAAASDPGFVQCGAERCDVASGNQCYLCDKAGDYTCHTLDLPADCSSPVWFWCDEDEDCAAGEVCVEACDADGPCSVPGRRCL
jgi:hypothetical protein